MSPEDRDLGYTWDMYDAACQVHDFSEGKSFKDYQQDKKLRWAVERLLEIIGQAAKEISENFKIRYSDVTWRKIIGLRNVLAHNYGDVKDEKVFLVVAKDVPVLMKQLRQILIEHNELP